MSQQSSNGLDTVIGGASTTSVDTQQAMSEATRLESEGDRAGAIGALRAAAPHDHEAAFRLAYLLDLVGEEDEAVQIYEDLISRQERPAINVLLNLAILHEDRGEIAAAERCLRQILDTNPNHERARLFMLDVRSSKDMYYDEEQARDMAKRSALMDTPVTDFELSVRARNCLKKMQIRTLGDLLKVSESELLSYKNFGETSLVEINQMLASKGLRLGQSLQQSRSQLKDELYEELKTQASEAVLNKPITQLDFSVRARKALQLLGVQTIADLATQTEAQLMGVKNFGATSLDEVNEVLTAYNLQLRNLD